MTENYLTKLEQELKSADKSKKDQLADEAWIWFDSQTFSTAEEGRVRRKLNELLDHQPIQARQQPRFVNLLERRHYPKSGWLAKYLEYTDFCGAPLPFHFFTGLVVLGAALKREAWIPFGRSPTYGAMYCVLIAPPGCCYKSTAIRIGVGLLKEAGITKIISGRATPEALSNMLSTIPGDAPKDAIALISATELYRFLAGHNTPANNQIVSALTSWYDCEDDDDDITITRDERRLNNIAISLLGASTVDWLVESLPKSVFAGGFMSRLLFIVQEHTDRVKSISPADDPLLRMELLEGLQEVVERFKGPKELTKEAFAYYDKWFITNYQSLSQADERTADFYQRRADYVRKVALVLAASEIAERIELVHMQQAVEVLELLNPALDSIITPMSLGDGGRDMDVIRRTLEKFHELSRTELVRKCCARGIDRDKMDRALDTLKAADLVEERKSGARGGRMYKWTKQ